MSTTGLLLWQDVAAQIESKPLFGTASGGTTTTLIDTTGDTSPFNTDDDDSRFIGDNWLYVHTGTHAGKERQVKRTGGYSPSASQLTVLRAVSGAYDNTDQYYVLTKLSHAQILDCLNTVLRTLLYRSLTPLTLVTDGDMESSGVTNWTASNATLTKATTAATTFRGSQSLKIVTTLANGYAQSASIPVLENQGGYVYVVGKPDPANGSASILDLILWDVTNAASISLSSSQVTWNQGDGDDWVVFKGSFTTPADCNRIAVLLRDETSGNTSYWDDCIVRMQNQRSYPAPSWLAEDNGVMEQVVYYPNARDYRSAIDTEPARVGWAALRRDNTAANPLWIDLDAYYPYPLFVQGMRQYSELTTDSSTTQVERQLLVAGAVAEGYRRLATPEGADKKIYQAKAQDWERTFNSLMGNQPRAHIKFKMSEPF